MRKAHVIMDGLRQAFSGRGRPADPWRFVLRFEHMRGLAALAGREGQAVLTPAEVADIVGAIPAFELDEDSLKAVIAVQRVLRDMKGDPRP